MIVNAGARLDRLPLSSLHRRPRGHDDHAIFLVAMLHSYGIAGVLGMIIGMLVVQIIVVLLFGVEPKKRRLEELDSESPSLPFRLESDF